MPHHARQLRSRTCLIVDQAQVNLDVLVSMAIQCHQLVVCSYHMYIMNELVFCPCRQLTMLDLVVLALVDLLPLAM